MGFFLITVGAVVAVSTVGVDWVGAGEWSGFGPLQRIGVGSGLALLLAGLPLLRVGDRPA
ncbi:MAG TPA: hypothetical protein EYH27_02810 [Anaerolineales bacterium]|nr:hypothetical protein [Anaerolineales bacterium]